MGSHRSREGQGRPADRRGSGAGNGAGTHPMWIDRAVKWLLPREEHFFDLLERGAAYALESGSLLTACCDRLTRAECEAIIAQIRDVERKADRVSAEAYEALNRTFVTPMDRSDI